MDSQANLVTMSVSDLVTMLSSEMTMLQPQPVPSAGSAIPRAEEPAPMASAERITNLDTVRGIATLGILIMNVVSYGLPDAAYSNLNAAGSVTLSDWVIGVGGEVFVDQKAMALFSLLFGVGVVVFADRATAKGKHPIRLSVWRNVLLFAIGAAHMAIWIGDILTVYALCSPVVLVLRGWKPRTLLIIGTGLVLSTAVSAAIAQSMIPENGAGLADFWLLADPSGATESGAHAVTVHYLYDFFARALGMMLIGVALFRLDIVQGNAAPRTYRRMALVGLGVGVPLATAGVVIQFATDFSPSIALAGEIPNTLATIPVALGYLGLISLWNQRPTSAVHERLRAEGRMALTNYLTQTIIGVIVLQVVFERGALTRTTLAGFVLAVWALQLLWSKAWLDRFRFGPFEWLWRMATYRRWQPLPHRSSATR